MNSFDRFVRTVWQVAGAFAVVWPAVVAAFGEPADTIGWVLAIAAAAMVLVNGVQNVITAAVPGPWRRWVRTVAAVVLGLAAATPLAVATVGTPASTSALIVGVLGAVVVLASAVKNRLDALEVSR